MISMRRIWQTIILGSLLCLFVGCGARLETRYAALRGDSINGLSAFIQTLRHSGLKVDTFPFATPDLGDTHECIFIFENDLGAIDQKTFDFWRKIARGFRVSTIVWVARNGDASLEFWNALLKRDRLNDKQKALATAEKQQSQSERSIELSTTFSVSKGILYGLENPGRKESEELTEVKIKGQEERTIQARWPLLRRFLPRSDVETLWSAQGEPLLVEEEIEGTRFLVLASAIPLLNASLADEGNRELCEQLIDSIRVDQRVAVIPTSHWVGDGDSKGGKKGGPQSMLDFLKVQPFPWIAAQLLLALVLFCWWKFPILGRPLVAGSRELQRFGRHVEALGELLRKARGRAFALGRIREWQRVRKTHGKTHES